MISKKEQTTKNIYQYYWSDKEKLIDRRGISTFYDLLDIF